MTKPLASAGNSLIDKVLVADPGMTRLAGHHLSWNRTLQNLFDARGVERRFFFYKDATLESLACFKNATAHFQYNFYRKVSEAPTLDSFESLLTHALYMQRDLVPLTPLVDRNTLVLGHSLDASSILGVGLWHATLAPEKRPHFALNVHFCIAPPTELTRKSYRLAMQCFVGNPRVRFFGVVDPVVDFLGEATGQKATLLPMPLDFPHAGNRVRNVHDIVYGFVGEDRQERNVAILPEALENYLEKGGKGRFLLQLAPVDPRSTPTLDRLRALAHRHPEQITLLLQGVYGEEYYDLLRRMSAMLLPFSSDIYHYFRPSQVLQEAIFMDIPAVVCGGGFMEYETRKWDNGSLVMQNAQELAKALFSFESTAQQRFEKAAAAGARYRAANNTEAFWEKLMACGRGRPGQGAAEICTFQGL
ncbi:hypothetical protein FACS1894205_1230 [Alphaproteobacteria bacterium]|nr:hypothetical protein FACS1894205_1230 [Alphaproteobacteria bacterium]